MKGPKGTLTLQMRDEIRYDISDDGISVQPANDTKQARAFWGMQRTLVQNLVTGVTRGLHQGAGDHRRRLSRRGAGQEAEACSSAIQHDVDIAIPEGLEVKTPDATTVEISGIDRQKVGQLAAEIRRWRKPEPYKGKGIKYRGEYIFRKEGKKK